MQGQPGCAPGPLHLPLLSPLVQRANLLSPTAQFRPDVFWRGFQKVPGDWCSHPQSSMFTFLSPRPVPSSLVHLCISRVEGQKECGGKEGQSHQTIPPGMMLSELSSHWPPTDATLILAPKHSLQATLTRRDCPLKTNDKNGQSSPQGTTYCMQTPLPCV